ncbi:P-loop containing nucleoside triphosphate hydrolase protein [Dunaliella salina]|uniref:CTP synthase n=1 Tax=Dunaliella salina TaxID=3046 RepID=A0ABQ7GPZ2_DUNSA|nr:P-loop containing nucleoside triphosphate hydrolase protein [Dunaliella salina]|eukprot:KAF5836679.1 P-loop containing nucleoside triphosphate hydrolase protein [Dunaliella salina]
MKYILVTGGVVSGLGKGVTASSIGVLMKACGLRVTSIKIDPYLNMDAGTMSPFEHGEVFVLDDGGEADLDLGNYERFLDITLTKDNNITTGKMYSYVIERERVGPSNLCNVHVSLVPVIGVVGEQKTKPTQHSVQVLRSLGLNPNLLACRCANPLEASVRDKLALFTQVEPHCVLTMHDVSNIWRVPGLMESQGAHHTICKVLGLGGSNSDKLDLSLWKANIADRWDSLTEPIKIALIGKYTGLSDAYLSVVKSLQHACMEARLKLVLSWVESNDLEESTATSQPEAYAASWAKLKEADGILVPGGFGGRGVEGKILAANYARTNRKPYLGICLGMQIAVIEFARNVLGMQEANSTEFAAATPSPVVVFMPEISTTHKGGTMRLGSRKTVLQTVSCTSAKLYQSEMYVYERHRHRCVEVGHELHWGKRLEPGVLFRPGKPAPLFLGFVLASGNRLGGYLRSRAIPKSPAKGPRPF